MSSITYGNYVFPNPLPFLAVDDESIFAEGTLDHVRQKISLIGRFTGENLSGLHVQKTNLINALSTGYTGLNVDGRIFTYCQPVSVSFSESDLNSILPYSIDFESYNEKSFSKYYGIKDPINTWSYAEQPDRTINATHTVSAVGIKNQYSKLVNAQNFVTSNSNGFEQLSAFFTGQNAFLRSTTEEIDEFRGSYSVTKNYTLTSSRNAITNDAIIIAKTQINYSKGQALSVSVNGSIIGAIGGTPVTESLFSKSEAKTLAQQSLLNSKSNYENSIYGLIVQDPVAYNYTHNDVANTIEFSFTFTNADDYRPSGPMHNYSISVAATKDSNNINVAVNGSIFYAGSDNLYTGGDIENNPRFVAVHNFFSGIDIYSIAQSGYQDYLNINSGYERNDYLNNKVFEQSITKNPYQSRIEYSYTYNNKINLSSGLTNCEVTISDKKPIKLSIVKNGMNGFVSQTVINKTIGEFNVTASSMDNSASVIPDLRKVADSMFTGCSIIAEESSTLDADSLSYSISKYYK